MTVLIGLATLTGLIEGCKPMSMLLIGSPGSGKSQLLKRFDTPENRHIKFGTNASAWGLQAVLTEGVGHGVTCVIAPEFQTWIYRKGAVWQALLGMLLPAMDEGVGTIYNGPNPKYLGNARIGLIAAMTRDVFNTYKGQFSTTGLLSRMLVALWDRTPDNIGKSRRRFNAGDRRELEPVRFRLPIRKATVGISRRLADSCEEYAQATAPQNINRDTDRFIALTKAHALLCGRPEATEDDWRSIQALAYLWEAKID